MTTDHHLVLIGVETHDDERLGGFPSARHSIHTMQQLLTDPARGGWPEEQITVIHDPRDAAALGARVASLARETRGLFLLYYAGKSSSVVTTRSFSRAGGGPPRTPGPQAAKCTRLVNELCLTVRQGITM